MPSLSDIANDIEARLDDLKTNTHGTWDNSNAIIGQLSQLEVKVDQINNTAQSGFTNLAQGLAVLIQIGIQNNDLLAVNDKQNQTIICWLDHIAHVLCDIKHNTDTEVKLQKEMSATLSLLNRILELVHSHEALEVLNQKKLEHRIEECCPEKQPAPKPCFENCSPPVVGDYSPVKTDWKPIHYDRSTAGQS